MEQTYEAVDSLPLLLGVFVEKYSNKFPQIVAINESMYGVCNGAFTEGQLLKVYFLKETKAVSAVVCGASTIIPTNSTLRFSIPFHSSSCPPTSILVKEETTSNSYHVFPTVCDLIKVNPLPCVVYVGQSWKSPNKEFSSINEGQVLIIKGMESQSRRKKKLLCIDTLSNKKLFLEECCKANFTTQSSRATFTLPTLLKHFKLPVNVTIQNNDTCPSIALKPVTILQEVTIRSIIASLCDLSHGMSGRTVCQIPNEVVEIISTVSIEVRVINLSEKDTMNFKITKDVLSKRLSLSLVVDIITDAVATRSTSQSLQKLILKSVEKSEWKNDIIGIDEGEYESVSLYDKMTFPITDNVVTTIATINVTNNPIDKKDDVKPPPVPPRPPRSNSLRVSTPPPTLPKRQLKLRDRTASESFDTTKLPAVTPSFPLYKSSNDTKSCEPGSQQLPLVQRPLNESFSTPPSSTDDNILNELKQNNAILIDRILELEKTITSTSRGLSQEDENKELTRKENKDVIKDYTVDEVVHLLEKMGLGKYGDNFKEEGIDGDLFCQLDDSVLENDLGISTKLHRIRLMSIIDGRHSVKKYTIL